MTTPAGVDPLVALLLVPRATEPETAADHYHSHFTRIATALLKNWVLAVDGRKFSLLEVEFYLLDLQFHKDPYAHGQEQQLSCGQWYFHKSGTGYREGSRKGLDLTFGQAGPEGVQFHAGVLIRAVQDVETGEVIEGPSLVVDRILRQFADSKVRELVSRTLADNLWASSLHGSRLCMEQLDATPMPAAGEPLPVHDPAAAGEAAPQTAGMLPSAEATSSSYTAAMGVHTGDAAPAALPSDLVKLEDNGGMANSSLLPLNADPRQPPLKRQRLVPGMGMGNQLQLPPHAQGLIYAGPRVGLTQKQPVDRDGWFVRRPYRFMSQPHLLKKGRAQTIVAVHRALEAVAMAMQAAQAAAAEGGAGQAPLPPVVPDVDLIARISGVKPATVQEYLKAYKFVV